MRLIELKAAKKKIRDEAYELLTEDGGDGMYTEDIIDALDSVPAVDAVPVVRCGWCKHRQNGDYCEKLAASTNGWWFCWMGEGTEVKENENGTSD